MDMICRSAYTLPRLGLNTVCIDDQESKVAKSVMDTAGVVIYWPEVVFKELIYLLHGAVEEWLGHIFFSGCIGFYILDNVRRRIRRYSDPSCMNVDDAPSHLGGILSLRISIYSENTFDLRKSLTPVGISVRKKTG